MNLEKIHFFHFLSILKISAKIRTNPDQNWSGPEIRTKTRTTLSDQHGPVRDSGPPDRTKKSWSGIPDHRTGPKLSWSGNPDHRTGPK